MMMATRPIPLRTIDATAAAAKPPVALVPSRSDAVPAQPGFLLAIATRPPPPPPPPLDRP